MVDTKQHPSILAGKNQRLTFDVPEAGRLLGIGRGQAYEAARRGQIPTIKIGKRLLVPRAALERMLEQGLLPPPGRSVSNDR